MSSFTYICFWGMYLLLATHAQNDQELKRIHIAKTLREANFTSPRPPIVLIPGVASSRLVAWKRKTCRGPNINIQDIVWLNLQKAIETYTYDRRCWIECLKLEKGQADPESCKIRADEGLDSISELSPGYFSPRATTVYSKLIHHLADEFGYDAGSLIAVPYDWRLSPGKLEERDLFFTTLKLKLETAVRQHRRPAIVFAHSMGNMIFLHFVAWLQSTDKKWERWLETHIWSYVGFAAPLLGAVATLRGVLSGEPMGVPISDLQSRELVLTFASTHLLNPRTTNRDDTGYPHDFVDPLVTIRSLQHGDLHYSVQNVESGELFRSMSEILNDNAMAEKHESLWRDYYNQSVNVLNTPAVRPPIRHVIMIHGVDLPTDVGFVYTQDKQNPSRLLLEETLFEQPCDYEPVEKTSSETINVGNHGHTITEEIYSVPQDQCRVEVWGIAKSLVNRNKRFIRHSPQARSGDGLVPYLSLSWARTWLNAYPGEPHVHRQPERIRQSIKLLDDWAPSVSSMMTSIDPAIDIHSTKHNNGFTTAVIEIEGVDHADILKDVYAHKAIFDLLLDHMDELDLNTTSSTFDVAQSPRGFARLLNWLRPRRDH